MPRNLHSLDAAGSILHARLMRTAFLFLALVSLLSACSEPTSPSLQETDLTNPNEAKVTPELTVDDLARALQIVWYEVTLPGTVEDHWKVGPVLEFGDGRKPITAGGASPFSGGSTVKLIARTTGEKLKVSVLGGGNTTNQLINLPSDWGGGTRLSNGGKVELEEFLIKVSSGEDGVDSSSTLQDDEYGLRLRIEPVE